MFVGALNEGDLTEQRMECSIPSAPTQLLPPQAADEVGGKEGWLRGGCDGSESERKRPNLDRRLTVD